MTGRIHKREWKRRLVVAAPPVDVTSGERTLGRPLFSPADAGTRGVRRSARGVRTVGVGGNTGGWRKRGIDPSRAGSQVHAISDYPQAARCQALHSSPSGARPRARSTA